ncbi:MAG TPA: biotin/lipoyl-containing protein [Candidatus Limnocylindrales bacterium]|nr:biotin/lipoyl-containing protein [Candidatus Limnocylindrales bacterium]
MSQDESMPMEEQPMPEPGVVERDRVDPVAVGPGDPAGTARPAVPERSPSQPAGTNEAPTNGAAADEAPANGVAADAADASLLALVDRLTAVLEKSELGELEVSTGGTTIILRSPSAIERSVAVTAAPILDVGVHPTDAPGTSGAPAAPATAAPVKPAVKAPLTGIFYGAPSPGAMPYVAVGDHVSVGQIIGLIEAMKLFNEIKSDLAGRVVRICADSGALVKAKQPLIEVEPA